MPSESLPTHIFERLTVRRVRILRQLAEGRTEPEIARETGVELSTVHSSIDELRDVVGEPSGRGLGRWWRENGADWAEWILAEAGIDLRPGP